MSLGAVTSTEATAWRTSMLDVPVTPRVVAEIVAVPFATAVTRPSLFTVATAGLDEDQVKPSTDTVFRFASRAVAVSFTVSPNETSVCERGVTSTD